MSDEFIDIMGNRRSYGSLPTDLSSQLMSVEPSSPRYFLEFRPCRAFLKDGSVVEHVIFAQAEAYVKSWGIWPEDDRKKRSLLVEDVVRIVESPVRLPAVFANRLYAAGETSMGGLRFDLVLNTGQCLPCGTGGVVDFVELPPTVHPDMIVDVIQGGPPLSGKWYEGRAAFPGASMPSAKADKYGRRRYRSQRHPGCAARGSRDAFSNLVSAAYLTNGHL